MAKIGKRSLLLVILTAAGMNVLAQNTNPYEKFGYTSSVEYKLPMDKLFRVINSDTTSEIKAMTIDFEKAIAYLLGENDALISEFAIDPKELMGWITPDPKASKYPHQSPYAYCSNNPVMKIDPNGMEDDWVQNVKTGQYQWMDNVKSPANTPQGYNYVGADGNDIVRSLGLESQYPQQSGKTGGVKVIGSSRETRAVNGVLTVSNTDVVGNIVATADISVRPENMSSNNVAGITFEGIRVNGYVLQSRSSDLDYIGSVNVEYGNQTYSSYLHPSTDYIIPVGTRGTQGSALVPAQNINRSNSFGNAYIQMGATNKSYFKNSPIKLNWGL